MRPDLRALPAFLAVLCGTAGCDHATKQVALAALAGVRTVSLAGDSVRFELAFNPGAFLGLGASLPEPIRDAFFLGFVPLLVLSLCAYLLFSHGRSAPALVVALGMIAGGGLANWFDRVIHEGAVTDFIALGLGPLRTGIFNVADVAVVGGVVLLLVLGRRPQQQSA